MSELAITLPPALVEEIAQRAAALLEVEPRFLSKTAIAERYGVSERTIRTWREKGCPGVRVGREVMYEVAAVDRWIESHA